MTRAHRTPSTEPAAEVGRVIYSMMVSLDGRIEGPGGDLSWHVIDEELHRWANDQARAADVFVYGRRVWETMVAYWPTADADPAMPEWMAEFARIWRPKPKLVASRTLASVGWNARLVRDGLAGEVARLKAEGRTLDVGGATMAADLLRAGLIDQIDAVVHPALVGRGTPMFPDDVRVDLRLLETRVFGSGQVLLRYEPRDSDRRSERPG